MLDFKILNDDGTLPTTTEELSNILMSACVRNTKHIEEPSSDEVLTLTEFIARPDEFSLESLDADILEGAAYYSKFDRLFDRGGMGVKIMNYHEFRDRVNDYQCANNISSLEYKNIQVGNLSINHLSSDSQLTPLTSDCEKLKSHVAEVFGFFVNIAATDRYELLESIEGETYAECKLDIIESCLDEMNVSSIRIESYIWKPTSPTNWSATSSEKEYPDKIILGLHESHEFDCKSRYFILEHRDKTRFPWMQ